MPIIRDEAEIKELQNKFEKRLKSINTQRIPVIIKTPYPEPSDVEAYWSDELKMWFSLNESLYERESWNPFGLRKPEPNSVITYMTCQINFAKKIVFTKKGKIDYRKISRAIFFKNDTGEVYIYHMGRFTGMGIKDFFFDKYKGETTKLDGRKWAVIGNLDEAKFANKVRDFVFEVEKIRELAKKSKK